MNLVPSMYGALFYGGLAAGQAVLAVGVADAGFEVGIAPQPDADTRFFKLDVPARDAVDLFDVDAMSQVERHDSVAQLDVRNEYTLEDCIKVRASASRKLLIFSK